MALPGDDAKKFEPDAVTDCVTGKPSDVVKLVGHLGKLTAGRFRLYQDLSFKVWVDIDKADMVDRFTLDEKGKLTRGQSVVWVRRSADIVLCESVQASHYETPPRQDSDDPAGYGWPR